MEALVLSPAWLDFGTARAGAEPQEQSFTLINAGNTEVVVHGHDEIIDSYDPDDGHIFEVDADPVLALQPGESQDVTVRFRPPTQGLWDARIDVNNGAEVLQLSGRGAAAVIGATAPARVSTLFGCRAEMPFEIFNQGDLPLHVTDIDLLSPDPTWSLHLDPSPFQLGPGDRTTVQVSFAPSWDITTGGLRNALVQVVSDDPLTPELAIRVEALAYEGVRIEEGFTYRPGHSVDLLVVADTDGVLSLYAERLADNIGVLVGILEDNNIAVQLAGLTGADICPSSEPAWTAGDASLASRRAALSAALEGDTGPGSEMLVEHAIAALSARPSCLSGFLRPDAQLHVIVLAGGPDGSPRPPEAQLIELHNAVPAASDVAVSAVIPTTDSGCAGTTYGAGYADMAIDSAGAIADLCAPSLDGAMEAIAGASLRVASGGLRYVLREAPDPDSLAVQVDGSTFTEWTYDPRDQAIIFGADTAPSTGAEVGIAYSPELDCRSF